eukprot:CAMPEP_0170569512 /NCGR_PEP_ID=MMETSP0224-20130122/590_1 /TAXON_ID=285029 /ORGANISM="Togula jolla, Strain CCCM 725" /LENGTH=59 /DNA_ID=CAMNT_0010891675 /DNA_START=197 /DNA_END=376 /DNA_ORIENTATION=+
MGEYGQGRPLWHWPEPVCDARAHMCAEMHQQASRCVQLSCEYVPARGPSDMPQPGVATL